MYLGSRRRPRPIGRENLEQPAHPTRPARAASLRRAISVLVLSLLMSVIPSLAAAAPNSSPPFDFSISAAPASLSIVPGNSDSSTISTSVSGGKAKHVKLSASVFPAGPTVSLSSDSVTAGASATLTVNVGAVVTPGSYTITVTGTEASNTHSTTIALTVPAPDFSISAAPTSLSILLGSSGTSSISTAVTSGVAGSVSLSASGAPVGVSASLSPTSVTAGSSSTLTVSVDAAVVPGNYTITVTGTEGSATHGAKVNLIVPSPDDFSISASPSSLTVQPGNSGTSSISTAVTSGVAGSVSLSASGAPVGVSASLSPTSVTAGSGSTLTVSVDAAVVPGGYTITVTGTEGSATHGAAVALTVGSPGVGGLTNGRFETGSLSGWTSSGTTSIISSGAHSGAFAARLGDVVSTNGDSSIAQTFIVPAGKTQLSFWYNVTCPDTLTYDWATATLSDNAAGTTLTVLPKTCTPAGTWVNRTASVTAGQSYTLTLINHDDNYPADPTYTLYDDVTLN